jgi:hypothetical protein
VKIGYNLSMIFQTGSPLFLALDVLIGYNVVVVILNSRA